MRDNLKAHMASGWVACVHNSSGSACHKGPRSDGHNGTHHDDARHSKMNKSPPVSQHCHGEGPPRLYKQ